MEAGQPIVEWDPQVALEAGMDTVVLVCQMDTAPGSIVPAEADVPIEQGSELFATV
ncbi:MAG: hypothetical protein L0G49_12410 [Luteococcus sp.]|uniref:hypothetical protein n=1 Tax=Luteococcus sp. TaxID=1969402 RepID=UPI0026494D72|nr:hypothetical protein [Luteococcus sp.]MDN5564548.1 hypothetical protein [Luteococcus sp.]